MNIKNISLKNIKNFKLLGVCSNLAEHFNCSAQLFRFLFTFFTIINYKAGVINYITIFLITNKQKNWYIAIFYEDDRII